MTEGRYVESRVAAIATGPAEAARAGALLFEAGGNAMDAAAAAALACTVVEPQAVDIGGYVAAGVVLEGATGRVWSLDANTVAPARATEDMYVCIPPVRPDGINEREYGCSVADDANVYGPLSAGVPAFLAGVGVLSERWGRLPWARIVEPARELLETAVYGEAAEAIRTKYEPIRRFPSTVEFLMRGGEIPAPEELWPRPELQRTLRRIADAGWRDFYEGELGRAIADFIGGAGGILSRDDMAAFSPRVTEPEKTRYRDAEVHTAILPNGGYSALRALDLLSGWGPLPSDTPAYWDRFAGVLRTVWTERLKSLCDPERPRGAHPHGTVHIAAADHEGNLVSLTISQGGLFGSCMAVPGTGIIPSHGMCRFEPRAGHPNSPGPRMRPLNNVCPLIIRTPSRDVAVGARGGRRIVSVAAQLAQRVVDYGAGVYDAILAERMHAMPGLPVEMAFEVAGAAHGAEILKTTREIRAGGNTWAVGV